MPMIGGEAAELAALESPPVAGDARDPYELGWVVDWMYGDAVLPPTPLPREAEPAAPWHRPIEVQVLEVGAGTRRSRHRRRHRARQLALL
jgi:hypothetical protein